MIQPTLMTSTKKIAIVIGMIISLSAGVYAQSAGPELNHFAGEGMSFDYPSGYSVKDESTKEVQQVTITREGSSVQLIIVIPQRLVLQNSLPVAVESFTQPTLKKVALTLGYDKNSPEPTPFQTQIGTKQAEGLRLRSTVSEKKTGEVIWLRLSLQLVGLVFVRSDADEPVGAQLWQTVSSSLRVKAPVVTVLGTTVDPTKHQKIEGDVLNGRALALGHPAYPPLARAARVFGTVHVQVLIDEEGNVIGARAADGHPLLQAAAVAAARQSRFSPTLLEGEPVRVTGVIKFEFHL
jgi:TonB family protein